MYQQFVQNKNFEFVNIDIRKKDVLENIFDAHSVVLLAGLVGDPITKKYPEMNDEINIKGILNVVKFVKKY